MARQVAETTRTALALIVPFALLLPSIALPLANLLWGYAAASETYSDFSTSLALFAPGLVFFTVHYLVLRGGLLMEQFCLTWLSEYLEAHSVSTRSTTDTKASDE